MNGNHTELISVDVTPRIYVASLADYNAGRLHGRWIDATLSPDAIRDEVRAMLQESEEELAEEWAIHDYENFSPVRLSEWETFEDVSEMARNIVEYGQLYAEVLAYFGDRGGLAESRKALEENYRGAFSSVGRYAESFVEEVYADVLSKLPDFIRREIDYDAIGRDMELGGDIFTIEMFTTDRGHEVHVFDAI